MWYVNTAARRAFSIEFVESHSREEIQSLIQMPPANEWVFHLNTQPSERVKRESAEELEKWGRAR